MTRKLLVGGVLSAAAAAVVFVFVLIAVVAGGQETSEASVGGPGTVDNTRIPEQYRAIFTTAVDRCPGLDQTVFAAQIEAESGWRPDAVSPVGAQGIAQFMPGTWAGYGVDGDGDGVKDPFNPADALPAAVDYDCALLKQVGALAGVTDVEPEELMLAGYNAGLGAVFQYRGVPPFPETRAYIDRIFTLAEKYEAAQVTVPPGGPVAGSTFQDGPPVDWPRANPRNVAAAIAWARAQAGSTGWYRRCMAFVRSAYGWSSSGFTDFGTVYAIDNYRQLPARYQHADRRPMPGALLFYRTGSAAGHVVIYLGGGLIASNDIEHNGVISVVPADAIEKRWGSTYVGWAPPWFPHAS